MSHDTEFRLFPSTAKHTMKHLSQSVCRRWLVLSLMALLCGASVAGELVKVPTRPDIITNVFWHETPNAKATVLIFTGGGGGFGRIENGLPTSANFLVRSAQHWIEEGFNYVVFGKPTDMPDLDFATRVSAPHLRDIESVLTWLKTKTTTPIWMVGTSRGTISTVYALINLKDPQIAGGVLTASVVSYKKVGAVPTQDLAKITVPMLVFHHEQDVCEICRPQEVTAVMKGLRNAPIKKLMMVNGGANPTGPACEAQHYHGFIGMEREAVASIAQWMRNPTH
jgi:dienelactone hydrolase